MCYSGTTTIGYKFVKIIVANWKMNPATEAEAAALARATDYEHVVICPPFIFLEAVAKTLQRATLGAQDLFWEGPTGPYTGEVSARELKNLGVTHVIIGHSERRLNLGETNDMIAYKVAAAFTEGLTPILCVGETADQRNAGRKETIIAEEVKTGLSRLPAACTTQSLYLAYEPIWAISTAPGAAPDKPEDTVATIGFIKQQLASLPYQPPVQFLYGGSVTPKNAADFLKYPEIAGALVGAASLNPEAINEIVYSIAGYN